jgi:hypothetical protein
MKRKIDADSQGAENQREETRLEIDRDPRDDARSNDMSAL